MTPSESGPVRRSLTVNLGIERAFQLFIERFDAIKPRDHNLLPVVTHEPPHQELEQHGDGWRSVTGGVSGEAGWPLYLRRYSEIAAEALQ